MRKNDLPGWNGQFVPFHLLEILFFVSAGLWLHVDSVFGQMNQPAMPDSSWLASKSTRYDSWLGKDKFDHSMVSAGLVATQFYVFHQELEWSTPRSRRIAAGSTLVIGIAKEIYDKAGRRGTPSWKDLLADLAGIGLGIMLVTL
jgi:uncharacterized protein YfiM (DUF2279 family)